MACCTFQHACASYKEQLINEMMLCSVAYVVR